MRPATRSRLRPWLLLAVLLLTAIYFFTGPRSTQTSEFYTRTKAAMDAHRKSPADVGSKAAAAQVAAEAKVRSGAGEEIVLDKVPDHDGGRGEQVSHKIAGNAAAAAAGAKQEPIASDEASSAAATKPKPVGKVNDKVFEKDEDDAVHGPSDDKKKSKTDDGDGVAKVGNTGKQAAESTTESPVMRQVSMLLDEILKKSPVIIFSKSTCPYSKKAKRILLEEYKIVPAPYVHEIDLMEHDDASHLTTDDPTPLGPALQAKLFEMTKRRTVPNVLVNGVSIGGGDDIEALDNASKLAEKITEIGGKRIMEVKRVASKAQADPVQVAEVAAAAKGGAALSDKAKEAIVEAKVKGL